MIALNTNKQIQACGKLDPKIIIFPPNVYRPFHQHIPISDTANLNEAFCPLFPQSPCSGRARQQVHVEPLAFLLRHFTSPESSCFTFMGKKTFRAFKDFFVQFTKKAIYATKHTSSLLTQNPTRSIRESSICSFLVQAITHSC